MSIDATRWAWTRQGLSAARKIVLLALADRAGADDTTWPSKDVIAADTGLDRKTVFEAITHLIQAGIIVDSGERRGPTNRVVVYGLIGVQHRTDTEDEIVPKTESSQKRNNTENGHESYRKRDVQSYRKRDTNRPYEPTKNQEEKPKRACAREAALPPWLSRPLWESYVEHRKKLRAPMTTRAKELAIGKLARWFEAGLLPETVINASLENGWKGLFEPKQQASPRSGVAEWLARQTADTTDDEREVVGERLQ